MIYKIFFIISSIVLLAACSFSEEEFIGTWKLLSIEPSQDDVKSRVPDEMVKINYDLQHPYFYLRLDGDKTFSHLNQTNYFTGNWHLDRDSSQIVLENVRNSQVVSVIRYNIEDLSKDESLHLSVGRSEFIQNMTAYTSVTLSNSFLSNVYDGQQSICVLAPENFKFSNDKFDIYSPQNNLWRVKPDNKETHEALVARTKRCLEFAIIYLRYSDYIEQSIIKKMPIILPIRLASNGIAMYQLDNIPSAWYGLFYNDEQALESYDLIQQTFPKCKINGRLGKINMLVDLLAQIIEHLE